MIEIFRGEPCSPSDIVPERAPPNFWKVCRITNRELVDVAQTGDILLFTGT